MFSTDQNIYLESYIWFVIVPLKSIQPENVALNNIVDNFIKNQCFEYTEINAVSESTLDMKRIKSKGMTCCDGNRLLI